MKHISEKISYLRGFAEGSKLNLDTDSGKIFEKTLEILTDINDALDGLSEAQNETEAYVESIDEDLTDIEEFILSVSEDGDFDDDDEYAYDEDEDDFYEVICPACGESYLTDFESFDRDDVICPECGEQFHLEEQVTEKLMHGDGCQCEACQAQA